MWVTLQPDGGSDKRAHNSWGACRSPSANSVTRYFCLGAVRRVGVAGRLVDRVDALLTERGTGWREAESHQARGNGKGSRVLPLSVFCLPIGSPR
jgi:hypothetical protein